MTEIVDFWQLTHLLTIDRNNGPAIGYRGSMSMHMRLRFNTDRATSQQDIKKVTMK